jgi:hypothetical protein
MTVRNMRNLASYWSTYLTVSINVVCMILKVSSIKKDLIYLCSLLLIRYSCSTFIISLLFYVSFNWSDYLIENNYFTKNTNSLKILYLADQVMFEIHVCKSLWFRPSYGETLKFLFYDIDWHRGFNWVLTFKTRFLSPYCVCSEQIIHQRYM